MEILDVFLSCKNLDESERPTTDLALAKDIYRFLSDRGLSVFFSNVSLEQRGVAAYKRAIDDALDAATVLVVVGTSSDHIGSEWVRYEWDGFFNDILSGIKPQGKVFVYLDNVGVASLPRALRQTQCLQHAAGSLDRLYRFIANALRKESRRVQVAISGSRKGQSDDWSEFCYLLGAAVAKEGYSVLATGGTGVGKSFYRGALAFLTSIGTDDLANRCKLVQVGSRDADRRRRNREGLLRQVDACVFVGGGSGTLEEYGILKKYGTKCIPVSASGGTAREIWNELVDQHRKHFSDEVLEAYTSLASRETGTEDLVSATVRVLRASLAEERSAG